MSASLRSHSQRLFPFERVLETADSVLDLALNLVGLALSLQLGITRRLADGFLDRALDFFADPAIRSLSMTASPIVVISSVH